jgi:hypothetical protein
LSIGKFRLGVRKLGLSASKQEIDALFNAADKKETHMDEAAFGKFIERVKAAGGSKHGGAGVAMSAADSATKANVLRFKAVAFTVAVMAEIDVIEGEKRLQQTRARRPLEAQLADALRRKNMMAPTSVVRAWGSNKNFVSLDDLVHHVVALGIDATEGELATFYERLDSGGTGQLGSEELRVGLRKLQARLRALCACARGVRAW